MIERGQHVKLFLRNGVVIEGIVVDNKNIGIVLMSLDNENLIVIHKPDEDVMMTKIMIKPENNYKSKTDDTQEVIKNKLHETLEIEDPALRDLSATELKKMVVEQEKQIVSQKTREHFGNPGDAKMTEYVSPFGTSQPNTLPSWIKARPTKGK